MKPEHVGQALRHLRQLRGMTQEQVAERAGVTKSMVSAYERARRKLYLDTATRIVYAMGFRMVDFLRAYEHVEKYPPVD